MDRCVDRWVGGFVSGWVGEWVGGLPIKLPFLANVASLPTVLYTLHHTCV